MPPARLARPLRVGYDLSRPPPWARLRLRELAFIGLAVVFSIAAMYQPETARAWTCFADFMCHCLPKLASQVCEFFKEGWKGVCDWFASMTQADAERGSAGDAARSFSDGLAPPPGSPVPRRNIDFATHSPMPPLSSEPPRHRRRVTVDEREDQDSFGW
jgi:hypothetical protein